MPSTTALTSSWRSARASARRGLSEYARIVACTGASFESGRPSLRRTSVRCPGAEASPLDLRDPGFERGRDRLADRLELDAVEHVLEEAADDQALRFRPREPAGHQVEELLAIDAADRRAVRAAHVVREDLEPWDRDRVRRRREHQVAALLVGIRLLRVFLDADHPAPNRGRVLAQRALEREVA